MAFSDQLFSSMFPSQKITELQEINDRLQQQYENNLESMQERMEQLEVHTRQLSLLFKTLYDLSIDKGVVTEQEFKDKLDQIDLSEWV